MSDSGPSTSRRGDYVSVQVGFWRSLWLVLRGARVRRWEWWDEAKSRQLHEWLDEDDYAVMEMDRDN